MQIKQDGTMTELLRRIGCHCEFELTFFSGIQRCFKKVKKTTTTKKTNGALNKPEKEVQATHEGSEIDFSPFAYFSK